MRYLSNLARHACLASLASAALLGAPSPAEAQSAQSAQSAPPQAQAAGAHRERARALANRGLELFEAGQYVDALQAFQAAEAEFHAPTILLRIARTQVRLGRLVDAHASYERIATEQLASYAPPEFFEAQTTARAELAEIAKRTPTVEVIVRGAGAQGARVAVDGVEVAAGRRVPQNPGTHTVSVRAPGAQEVLREVTITEGAAERVEVDLGSSSGPAGGAPGGAGRDGGRAGLGRAEGRLLTTDRRHRHKKNGTPGAWRPAWRAGWSARRRSCRADQNAPPTLPTTDQVSPPVAAVPSPSSSKKAGLTLKRAPSLMFGVSMRSTPPLTGTPSARPSPSSPA